MLFVQKPRTTNSSALFEFRRFYKMFRPMERLGETELPAAEPLFRELRHPDRDGTLQVCQGEADPRDPQVAVLG